MIARSYLYVPGDSGDRLERAPIRGTDAVIADLEDAVAARPQSRRGRSGRRVAGAAGRRRSRVVAANRRFRAAGFGQGTTGLEIVEDLPDVDVVLVPVSGGAWVAQQAAIS